MNNHINDGGPAFPGMTYISQDGKKNPEGMTLRDYFAAAALQGLLTSPAETEFGVSHFAAAAYECADAMLKAREVKP